MAGHDWNRAQLIKGWPLREMLLAYVAWASSQTAESFRFTQLLYQIRMVFGGEEKPPDIPKLLREDRRK